QRAARNRLHELRTDDPARHPLPDKRPPQAQIVLDADLYAIVALIKAPGNLHAARDAPDVLELDDAIGRSWSLDGLPADRDQAASGTHREAALAARIRQAPDVAIVRQALRPALDVGGQREDPLGRSVHAHPKHAPHGRRTARSVAGL